MSTPATSLTPAEAAGANVRAEMARRKVSQTRVAQHLDLSQTAVSQRLAGRVAFDVNELHAIADLLGVPLPSLLPEHRVDRGMEPRARSA